VPQKSCCAILVVIFLVGCGSKEPYRSGGRTATYWAKVLTEHDVEQRRKAATKIGPLALSDDGALQSLLGALKDEDVKVRLATIRSLKIYGTAKTAQVLPALHDVQDKDGDTSVREAAAAAIDALGKH
jgi:HEAT repeat protein